MITLDLSHNNGALSQDELKQMVSYGQLALKKLQAKEGPGSEFTGWVNLPKDYDQGEFDRILKASEKIKEDSDILVVIGIGGSYLGARAAIEMLRHSYHNSLPKEKRDGSKIYYLGNHMSADAFQDFMDLLGEEEVSVNVISKSGTTTEPAIAFRFMKDYMEKRYGKEEAARRIYATTDEKKGALKELADQEGYESFVVPDDIGGRYSVLTAVGLLPLACAGIDIQRVMAGAQKAMEQYNQMEVNDALTYACARNILSRKGKEVEILVNYEPKLTTFAEWWKQLFGESEGKNHKGIFPASVSFSTDLHSMGQYIQDGRRILFETVLHVGKAQRDVEILANEENLDGLNFLAGKSLHEINDFAYQGTILAHNDGGVPVQVIHIDELNEEHFGQLVYFFEMACAISGYLLGVNPFDQPGVEAYKKNMFALLGKPGYEDLKSELEGRM